AVVEDPDGIEPAGLAPLPLCVSLDDHAQQDLRIRTCLGELLHEDSNLHFPSLALIQRAGDQQGLRRFRFAARRVSSLRARRGSRVRRCSWARASEAWSPMAAATSPSSYQAQGAS